MNIEDYSTNLFKNGFVHIKSLLNKSDISLVDKAINDVYKNPTPFRIKVLDKKSEFFMDFRNWVRFDSVKKVCLLPKLIDIATQISKSKNCWLMHEDVIIKRGYASLTPLHHDRPYFIVKGKLNLSIWVSTSNVSKTESLICYKKSHLTNNLYLPKLFISDTDAFLSNNKNNKKFIPLRRKLLDKNEAVRFNLNIGDVIIFLNKTVHEAPAHDRDKTRKSIAIRYLLDGSKLTEVYFNDVPPYERMGLKIKENLEIPVKFFPKIR